MSYKIDLARCLIYKAFKISSSYVIFYSELKKVKNFPQKNMNPINVIDKSN